MYFLLKVRPFLGDIRSFSGVYSCRMFPAHEIKGQQFDTARSSFSFFLNFTPPGLRQKKKQNQPTPSNVISEDAAGFS